MITLKEYNTFPIGEVFLSGLTVNSPFGVYMTENESGRGLKWVAVKGQIDWALYIGWDDEDFEHIKKHGDKVTNKKNIKKLVNCSEEVLCLYRY